MHRFEEIVGARPETLLRVQGGIFSGMDAESIVHLDWTEEYPKSLLAGALLQLIRYSFKDLRKPDYKEDVYQRCEKIVSPMLTNLDTPALQHYH